MASDCPDARPGGAPFAAPSLSLTLDQARAFGAGRVAAAGSTDAAQPQLRPLGPPHLRVFENGFLKPSVRVEGAPTMDDWE